MANRGCSLLVRNLRYETTPEKVREVFERVGRVKDVYLPIDHTTREPRGFGFVEYFEEKDAQDAVRQFDRFVLDGNELSVIIAQDRRKSPHTMRRILAERQNGRYQRGSPLAGRGPPGRDYGGGRYDGRGGRYERGYDGGYDGGYNYKGNGEMYGRRGREGYEEGYGAHDDYRREGYRGGVMMDERRHHGGGRSRSRSRPHDGYRGDRHRYPPGDGGRRGRYHERDREEDYDTRPRSSSR
ncbi:RNA binding motif-containing protein, putative [Eimeria brunetti]|uniref:RNA binding motif-containing protein, putative n=1 Tax=Eimeria brunetti TaxID=51314 RepID=U6LT42_9EIME|nr:RNA binding motif-containing protein, putative [Eimeria brunetti]